jgi:hypothetical protein
MVSIATTPSKRREGKSMTILPDAISAYFAASTDPERRSFETCFTSDAIVHDEGQIHQGIEDIKAWHIKASGPSPGVARILSMREELGKNIVPTEISGAFKGSPIVLDFTFTLKDKRIAELEIH